MLVCERLLLLHVVCVSLLARYSYSLSEKNNGRRAAGRHRTPPGPARAEARTPPGHLLNMEWSSILDPWDDGAVT